MLKPFSKRAHKLPLGIYEHYKGNRYEVIGVGRHSETHEELVIYRGQYGPHDLWVRPLESFLENVTLENGQVVERFKLISGKVCASECC
jgi:hypothetical protein